VANRNRVHPLYLISDATPTVPQKVAVRMQNVPRETSEGNCALSGSRDFEAPDPDGVVGVVQCDEKHPVCSNCSRRELECVYAEVGINTDAAEASTTASPDSLPQIEPTGAPGPVRRQQCCRNRHVELTCP
jgi:hypothetical protein